MYEEYLLDNDDNLTKVKKSIIRRANATGDLSRYDVKYLINHYLTGREMAPPKNVDSLIDNVKKTLKLSTSSGGDTFNKVVAQVKSITSIEQNINCLEIEMCERYDPCCKVETQFRGIVPSKLELQVQFFLYRLWILLQDLSSTRF